MINVLNLNLMIHFRVLEKILSGDGTSSYKLYYITIAHKYVFYIFILLLVIYFTILLILTNIILVISYGKMVN